MKTIIELENKEIFKRIWPIFALKYTFEPREMINTTHQEGKENPVEPCKFVRMYKLAEGNRTEKFLDLYITNFNVYQYPCGVKKEDDDTLKTILSNIFYDQEEYENMWKLHHLAKENKHYDKVVLEKGEDFVKDPRLWIDFNNKHEEKIAEINYGLPISKFNLNNEPKNLEKE